MRRFSLFTTLLLLSGILIGFSFDSAITPVWKYPAEFKVPRNAIEVPTSSCGWVAPAESLNSLGDLRGMVTDQHGNAFALDVSYHAIWKFSPSGKLTWKVKFDPTQGDASIEQANGIAVSSDGIVCVGDTRKKRIVLFDSTGKYIRTFPVDIPAAQLIFGKDNTLYTVGFGLMYKGPYISHYDLQGNLLRKLYDRDSVTRKGDKSGNPGCFAMDDDGNLYYSLYYPYRIMKFSPEGKLLASFSSNRTVRWGLIDMDLPGIGKSKTLSCGGVRGLSIIEGKYLAAAVVDTGLSPWGIDLFTLDGEFVKSIESESFPSEMKNFQYWSAGRNNELRFDIIYSDYALIQNYAVRWDELVKK